MQSRRGLALEPMLGMPASSLAWPRKGYDQGYDGQADEMESLERAMEAGRGQPVSLATDQMRRKLHSDKRFCLNGDVHGMCIARAQHVHMPTFSPSRTACTVKLAKRLPREVASSMMLYAGTEIDHFWYRITPPPSGVSAALGRSATPLLGDRPRGGAAVTATPSCVHVCAQ